MQELLINKTNDITKILLVENGNLIEKYEEEVGQERIEGYIYLGIVENILPGMQAAFVNIGKDKNTFIHIRDVIPKVSEETGNKNEDFSKYNINDYLKKDMPILVQVKKDSTNKKGARISTHLSMPGRFVVIMPNEKFITISQKIDDLQERDRLKNILKKNLPQNYGAIIRTSAIGKSEEEIVKDINKVINKYIEIEKEFNREKQKNGVVPELLYKSEDILERVITDLMDQNLNRICTNDDEIYKLINDKLKEENQEIKVEKQENILNMYDIQEQLKKINDRKIWLRCGGFITIDKTEALTAIDVNSREIHWQERLGTYNFYSK